MKEQPGNPPRKKDDNFPLREWIFKELEELIVLKENHNGEMENAGTERGQGSQQMIYQGTHGGKTSYRCGESFHQNLPNKRASPLERHSINAPAAGGASIRAQSLHDIGVTLNGWEKFLLEIAPSEALEGTHKRETFQVQEKHQCQLAQDGLRTTRLGKKPEKENFSHSSNLITHQRLHAGEQLYKCGD